jgi:hypothetical protein
MDSLLYGRTSRYLRCHVRRFDSVFPRFAAVLRLIPIMAVYIDGQARPKHLHKRIPFKRCECNPRSTGSAHRCSNNKSTEQRFTAFGFTK